VRNRWIVVASFAALGLAIAMADYAWVEYSYYHQIVTPDWLFLPLLCLNPPSLLSAAFIDIQPTEREVVIVWTVIALLNSALYAAIAAATTKHFGKPR
jgi:hypothetical protein